MDRPLLAKGYTMIEMLLVIMVLTILLLLSIQAVPSTTHKPLGFVIDEIVLQQYRAIVECERTDYEEYDCDIHFNRKGGIDQANTYELYYIYDQPIIVSLGTGRVYEKQDE